MRRMSIFGVTPGMNLGGDIRTPGGQLLLASGIELKADHLHLLHRRGCLFVDVLDGLTDDVETSETVSEAVREQNAHAVDDLYRAVGKRTASAVDTSRDEYARRDLKGRALAQAAPVEKELHAVASAAADLVDEVLDTQATLGLSAVRFYDQHTSQHSVGTAVAAAILGRELGWPRQALYDLAIGAMMHDFGKLYVDSEVLAKTCDDLTPDDVETLKRHAQLGYEGVREVFGPGTLSNHVPFQHHERQDGTGYPRGLRGSNTVVNPMQRMGPDQILPIAQVASIADVFDALNSDRPYRPAVPADVLAELMLSVAGTSLNAELVGRFLKVMQLYPAGAEIVMHGHPDLEGCTGVVVRAGECDPRRPVVRVLYTPAGKQLLPCDLPLEDYPELSLDLTYIFSKDAVTPLPTQKGSDLVQLARRHAMRELASPMICA